MSHLQPVPSGESTPEGTGVTAPLPELLAEYLRRSARGDEQAFAALYDATSARVHGLVLRVVRDPAQSEEVTQEVFLQVWRTAARYDESKGSALAWLMTLAHRRAVDRVRAAEAVSRQDTSFHQNTQVVPHDSTAEAAEASMESRRVRSALAELTTVQREAIELAYFGGYTHTEVATMLDLPVGTAKTRIRDGLIRLRDAMGVGQ
ncbi:RNA polymerase sigma-70 factor (ECF subfamily) [Marmoricola sp. OAE513]|uniref:ECF RNA polymerase sigma factor SigK n=1 Tax=Marmoricola sp. OAE513 TaxID=2817894 RepID=UPI001AE61EE6